MKIDPWSGLVLPTSLPLPQGSPALKGVRDRNIFLKTSGFFFAFKISCQCPVDIKLGAHWVG